MQVGELITRRSASNLAFAFIMLPLEKRKSMFSLYAFCREVDDVADDESIPTDERRRQLTEWREDLLLALNDGQPKLSVNQELQLVNRQYPLPFEYFDELLKGMESDLVTVRFQTDEDLQGYCYRVASVVGLLCIQIFEYQNPACREYAVLIGKALQYTNILRDVWSDAKRGRIYLPTEDLERFGVTEEEILTGKYSDRYRRLAEDMARRAKAFYAQAAAALPPEDRRSMITAEMMGCVYWRLLKRLEARGFDVFSEDRVRVSRPHKFYLLLVTWLCSRLGLKARPYGDGVVPASG